MLFRSQCGNAEQVYQRAWAYIVMVSPEPIIDLIHKVADAQYEKGLAEGRKQKVEQLNGVLELVVNALRDSE